MRILQEKVPKGIHDPSSKVRGLCLLRVSGMVIEIKSKERKIMKITINEFYWSSDPYLGREGYTARGGVEISQSEHEGFENFINIGDHVFKISELKRAINVIEGGDWG